MQTNQTTQDFVQINNKRFSIQQFLDLLELQQKYLSKQDNSDSEEEQEDDSFGLVEDEYNLYNQKKEECLQSVLNNFNFEAVVKSYNDETAEHEVYRHIDDLMDAAYELMSELYDELMQSDVETEVLACTKGMLVCTINKEGQIRLSSTIMAVGDINLSKG